MALCCGPARHHADGSGFGAVINHYLKTYLVRTFDTCLGDTIESHHS
jgi:hypothetical protein